MLIPLSLRVQCQTLSVDWSQLYAVVYKMRIFLCRYCKRLAQLLRRKSHGSMLLLQL